MRWTWSFRPSSGHGWIRRADRLLLLFLPFRFGSWSAFGCGVCFGIESFESFESFESASAAGGISGLPVLSALAEARLDSFLNS